VLSAFALLDRHHAGQLQLALPATIPTATVNVRTAGSQIVQPGATTPATIVAATPTIALIADHASKSTICPARDKLLPNVKRLRQSARMRLHCILDRRQQRLGNGGNLEIRSDSSGRPQYVRLKITADWETSADTFPIGSTILAGFGSY
jgi:hypothetical protein